MNSEESPIAEHLQPTLFEMPEPDAIGAVKRWVHTGTTASRDEQLVDNLRRDLVNGVSIRRSCRINGCSLNTARIIRRELTIAGKLDAVKENEARGWLELAELAREQLAERILGGKVPDIVLNAAAGTATDKWLLLTGQATERVEHKKESSVEVVLRAFEERHAAQLASGPAQIAASGLGSAADSAQVVYVEACGPATTVADRTDDSAEGQPEASADHASKEGGGGSPQPGTPETSMGR